MVNWIVIGSAAVGILTPLMKKAGEKVAEKTGEAIFNGKMNLHLFRCIHQASAIS